MATVVPLAAVLGLAAAAAAYAVGSHALDKRRAAVLAFGFGVPVGAVAFALGTG